MRVDRGGDEHTTHEKFQSYSHQVHDKNADLYINKKRTSG